MARDVSQLLRLEQMRRDFVANVSHELRTPLTVIHGYLEMLDADDNPEWAPMLAEMRRQSQRMTQLVEDLLTLSRLEARDQLPEEHVAMAPMLANLRREAEALSQGRHRVQVEDAGAGRPARRHRRNCTAPSPTWSATRCATPPTAASIAIRLSRDADGGAVLAVRDTGYGIPAAHLPRLTERFYRVSTSRSRESGGTGLGLAIVKHVLGLHEAQLRIDSEVGRRQHLLLPLRPRARARPRPRPRLYRHPSRHDRRFQPADSLHDPSLYANRELWQLDFNFRVLAQAQDPSVPLLERLRYLCISCTNLDEFFEIRGGTVRHAVELEPAGGHGRACAGACCWSASTSARRRWWTRSTAAATRSCARRLPSRASACCSASSGRRNRPAGCARISATRSCRCCRRSASTRRTRSRKILNKSLNIVVRAGGPRRLRPRGPPRHRARAALAAADHPPARRRRRRRRRHDFVFLSRGAVRVRATSCSPA